MTASYTGSYAHRPEAPPIPAPDQMALMKDTAHASRCRQFLDYFYRYDTPKRCELERQWNRARMFDAAKQWLQPVRGSALGARLWYQWEPIRMTRGQQLYPKPVYNIFSQAIQDEVARLIKAGSKPYIRCDDPEKDEGAKLSKQLLDYRNRENGWQRQQRLGGYHMAMFGQWIEVSRWQNNRMALTRLPSPNAVQCSECDVKLADTAVPFELGRTMQARFGPTTPAGHPMAEPAGDMAIANGCPECGADLIEAAIPRSSYQNGQRPQDYLGRDLTIDVPLGQDITEVKSPYAVFPENQGQGYQHASELEECAFRDPRTIPWIEARFDNSEGLKPKFDQAVFAHHPAVSGLWGLISSGAGDGLWGHHRMVDEYVMKPCPAFPKGMYIAMTGERLLQHSELIIPGTDIPRVSISWAQWELRENEIWGKSLAEDLFLVQTTLNACFSQVLDIQQKFTNPKLILQEGQHLDFAGGANSPYAGDMWIMNSRGLGPEIKREPFIFGHTGNVQNIFELIDRLLKQVENITGARAPEIGNVSGVELNYSALLFAASKSAERRGPRTAGLRDLLVDTWKHELRLCSSLYLQEEQRYMSFQDDRKRWKVIQIAGFAMEGQTDVTVEAEPYVDDGIAKRASIEQGLKWGTVRTSTTGGDFFADRDINRAIGVPEDLNLDRNKQLDHAHDEYEVFFDEGGEPMVDQYGDDHQIHWNANSIDLQSPKADEMKDEALRLGGDAYRWSNVLKWTWEWERLLTQLLQQRMMMQQMPGGTTQGLAQQMQTMGAPPEAIQQAVQQANAAAQALAGFPDALELQINECWLRLLGASAMQSGIDLNSQPGQIIARLVRFKCHALAHWQLLRMAMAAQAAPAAGPGAPSPAGPAGPGENAANPLIPAAQQPGSVDAVAA